MEVRTGRGCLEEKRAKKDKQVPGGQAQYPPKKARIPLRKKDVTGWYRDLGAGRKRKRRRKKRSRCVPIGAERGRTVWRRNCQETPLGGKIKRGGWGGNHSILPTQKKSGGSTTIVLKNPRRKTIFVLKGPGGKKKERPTLLHSPKHKKKKIKTERKNQLPRKTEADQRERRGGGELPKEGRWKKGESNPPRQLLKWEAPREKRA